MPELPEVETVRRGLAPALEGRVIVRAETRRPDLRFPLPPNFAARLTGARIEKLDRRAKYLLAHLSTGETWVSHLGMSGRFTLLDGANLRQPGEFHFAPATSPTHTHVVIGTQDGARLEYNDPRRFGFMDLIETTTLNAHPTFARLGPEPLAISLDQLHHACRGRAQSIKATLLDQHVIAGLGNIYVCEALHRAGIAPGRAAGRIAAARMGRLLEAIRAVIAEAIEAGGSSLRDYAQTNGALGYFQHRFRVYDREGAVCLTPQCAGIVARQVQSGRSTFHCPVCQR